eukprot:Selendium_serpulae@DN5523_c0_g1_i1.p1
MPEYDALSPSGASPTASPNGGPRTFGQRLRASLNSRRAPRASRPVQPPRLMKICGCCCPKNGGAWSPLESASTGPSVERRNNQPVYDERLMPGDVTDAATDRDMTTDTSSIRDGVVPSRRGSCVAPEDAPSSHIRPLVGITAHTDPQWLPCGPPPLNGGTAQHGAVEYGADYGVEMGLNNFQSTPPHPVHEESYESHQPSSPIPAIIVLPSCDEIVQTLPPVLTEAVISKFNVFTSSREIRSSSRERHVADIGFADFGGHRGNLDDMTAAAVIDFGDDVLSNGAVNSLASDGARRPSAIEFGDESPTQGFGNSAFQWDEQNHNFHNSDKLPKEFSLLDSTGEIMNFLTSTTALTEIEEEADSPKETSVNLSRPMFPEQQSTDTDQFVREVVASFDHRF